MFEMDLTSPTRDDENEPLHVFIQRNMSEKVNSPPADSFGSSSAATVAFANLLIAGIRATPGLTKAALRFDIE